VKVLHTEWSDGWGGQEIRIISEMEGVREKGVEVILACREGSKIKKEAIKRDFKVYTLPFRGNFDLNTIWNLMKIIKNEKVDIVNTHSGKDTWVGGISAKLVGAKFIRTRHLNNRINPSRLNFINELADFIITTGSVVRENMIKFNRIKPEKIVSIPTGVDENIFDPKKYNKTILRQKFNYKKPIVVGALGVLRRVKGHEFFIEAAKKILAINNNVEFVIAGDGPLRKYLEEKIGNNSNIKLLGHQNAPEFLASIDVFVLPSLNEGVPQSLIQALMMNVASIASDVGSVQDLYKDNFLLVKPRNVEELANNIEKLIKNPNMFGNTREYMVKNFSKKVMIEKVLDVYQKVMS